MATVLRWRQGVNGPTAPLTLETGDPDNDSLAGATVTLTAEPLDGGTPVIDAQTVEVLDAEAMLVRYDRKEAEVANHVRLRAHFVATYSDGSQQAFPEEGYLLLIIEPTLGGGA